MHTPARIATLLLIPASFALASEIGRPGKTIIIAEDETVEGIELSVPHGGVITGQVTDADGRPMPEESISLFQLDERHPTRSVRMRKAGESSAVKRKPQVQ